MISSRVVASKPLRLTHRPRQVLDAIALLVLRMQLHRTALACPRESKEQLLTTRLIALWMPNQKTDPMQFAIIAKFESESEHRGRKGEKKGVGVENLDVHHRGTACLGSQIRAPCWPRNRVRSLCGSWRYIFSYSFRSPRVCRLKKGLEGTFTSCSTQTRLVGVRVWVGVGLDVESKLGLDLVRARVRVRVVLGPKLQSPKHNLKLC